MHQKWTQEEIQKIVLDYLKSNLTIEIDAKKPDSYEDGGSKYIDITVKVKLDGEKIADDRTSFRVE